MKKLTTEILASFAIQGSNKELPAGFSLADIRRAGLSQEEIDAWEKEWDSVPILVKPYTALLKDIKAKKRVHNQSTFGPDHDAETNLCGTPMWTAGHLVNMAGAVGYELKKKYGWEVAATIIHRKTHPDYPLQNFGGIPQSWAMAYIETMAAREKKEEKENGKSTLS